MADDEPRRFKWIRVGRATRDLEFKDDDSDSANIEKGSLFFDPCTAAEVRQAEGAGEWQRQFVRVDGVEVAPALTYEYVGSLELPLPMKGFHALEWLEQKEERWQQFQEQQIQSDVTVADYMEVLR